MNALNRSTPDAEAVAKALGGAKRNASGWVARCPAHDDHNPSLSLSDAGGGKVLWHCLTGCSQEAVMAALKDRELIGGGPSKWSEHEYTYLKRDGSFHLNVYVKRDAVTEKKIKIHGRDAVRNSPAGVKPPHPPYRLPELLAAPDKPVVIVEGEHAAEKLRAAWGVLATTSKGGAGKWNLTNWSYLKGRNCDLVSDGDEPGRKHMRGLADHLDGLGAKVRLMLTPGDANPTSATRTGFQLISSDFDRRPSCKGLVSLMGGLGKRL